MCSFQFWAKRQPTSPAVSDRPHVRPRKRGKRGKEGGGAPARQKACQEVVVVWDSGEEGTRSQRRA
jgi:hypothetical protein